MLTEEIRTAAWREFAKTTEYAALQHTTKNSTLLDREVRAGIKDGGDYNCEALQRATKKLREALDWKVSDSSNITQEKVAASAQPSEPEYSEATDPNFPQRGPHEPGHLYQGRVNFYRESRAKRAWRDREYARMAAQPPAQSTINRTKAELKLRRVEQEQYALRKANQS